MIDYPKPNITVNVNLTNPGQFFACCGLLELADRLDSGADGWFGEHTFHLKTKADLKTLIGSIVNAELKQIDPDDEMSTPIFLSDPFNIRLDWWNDRITDGKQLKVWAGSMRNFRICRAMQQAMSSIKDLGRMFEHAEVVYDPMEKKKKVEPFYFDSQRGWNAQSIDIGFAPDSLKMTTAACAATEFLCFVGLQRFRPATASRRPIFEYFSWSAPLPVVIAQAVVSGAIKIGKIRCFRFQNAFRTDQKKHKSFLPATPIGV
jgi:CRISPR-associated protein Csb3